MADPTVPDPRIIVAYEEGGRKKYARFAEDKAIDFVRRNRSRNAARIVTDEEAADVESRAAAVAAAKAAPRSETSGLGTFVTEAGAGVLSTATAIPRLGLAGTQWALEKAGHADDARALGEVSKQLEGHQILENLAAVSTELEGGPSAEATARRAGELMRRQAEQHEVAATGGKLTGMVIGAGMSGWGGLGHKAGATVAGLAGQAGRAGLTARALGGATSAAIESIPMGPTIVGDKEYREQRIAPAGEMLGTSALTVAVGGLTGAAIPVAGAAVGRVGRGLKTGVGKIFGRGKALAREGVEAGAEEAGEAAAGRAATGVGTETEAGIGAAGGVKSGAKVARTEARQTRITATIDDAGMTAEQKARARTLVDNTPDDVINGHVQTEIKQPVAPETASYFRRFVHGEDVGKVREGANGEAALGLADEINAGTTATKATSKFHNSGSMLKPQTVRNKLVEGGFAREAPAMQRKLASECADELDTVVATADPSIRSALQKVARATRDIEARMAEAGTPEEVFVWGDRLRAMQLNAAAKWGKQAAQGAGPAVDDVAELLNTQYDRTRTLLGGDVWGAAGRAQNATNAAYSRMIRAEKNALDLFSEQLAGPWEGKAYVPTERVAHEGKILSHLESLGSVRGNPARRAAKELIEARAEYAKAVQSWGLPEAEAKAAQKLADSAARVEAIITKADRQRVAIDQVEQYWKIRERSNLFDLVPGKFGKLLGTANDSGRRFIATMEAGERVQQTISLETSAIGMVFGAARSKAGAVAGAVGKAAHKATEAVKGVAKHQTMHTAVEFAERGVHHGAEMVVAGGPAAAIVAFQGSEKSPEEAYRKKAEQIRRVVSDNGESIQRAVAASAGQYADSEPSLILSATETAVRAAQYLASKLPGGGMGRGMFPLSERPTPPRAEIERFARIYEAVQDPNVILRDLKNGTITRDQVDAVRAVYPLKFKRIQELVLEHIIDADAAGKPISLHKRQLLDTLLDLGGLGEPTLSNEFALNYGPALSAKPAQQGPKPRSRPSKLGERMATGTTTMLGGAG